MRMFVPALSCLFITWSLQPAQGTNISLPPLIRIRMRILGSVPLTNGSGSGIRLRILPFSALTFKTATKSFYAYSFLKLYFHYASKIKSHKKSHKQQKPRFFFIFLLVDGRIWIRSRIRTNKLRIRIQTQENKNMRSDLTIRIRTLVFSIA